jgi:hypothetical protein
VRGRFFRSTATGTRIISEKISASLLYTQRRMNQLKPLFRHLPGSTSVGDITVVLQDVYYDVLSIKHLTTKRPNPEGEGKHISLPFLLVTLARNQKAIEIKLT